MLRAKRQKQGIEPTSISFKMNAAFHSKTWHLGERIKREVLFLFTLFLQVLS